METLVQGFASEIAAPRSEYFSFSDSCTAVTL